MINRRHVLQVLSAAPAAAALPACAGEPLPDPIAAWRSPGAGEADPRRHALAHAILAPNPHNRQPWLAALEGADGLRLWVDLDRRLPETDPFDRQIVLGCGAFLELFDLAARRAGQRAEITLWPEGAPQPRLDSRPFAVLRLSPDAGVAKDPLADHILNRRTNREPFDLAKIPPVAALEVCAAAAAGPGLTAGWTNAPEEAAALRDLVWRGWRLEMATPAALQESVDLMRLGKREIARARDGVSIDFPMLGVLRALGIVTRENLADPNSQASKSGAQMWEKMASTAPAFIWIASADNSRASQIAAGRAYARLNLAAAAQGLSVHPWSMTLQEYPEMAELYQETAVRFGASAAAPVQMLARIGYGPEIPPAPRRGLEAHLPA